MRKHPPPLLPPPLPRRRLRRIIVRGLRVVAGLEGVHPQGPPLTGGPPPQEEVGVVEVGVVGVVGLGGVGGVVGVQVNGSISSISSRSHIVCRCGKVLSYPPSILPPSLGSRDIYPN